MLSIGDVLSHKFPFFRFSDECTPPSEFVWRPGCMSHKDVLHNNHLYAHGVGERILKVVDIYKPPKPYHKRVFYVASYVCPDEKLRNNNALMSVSVVKFNRMIKGFGHGYLLNPCMDPSSDDFEMYTSCGGCGDPIMEYGSHGGCRP